MHREKLIEAITGALDQIAGDTSAESALGAAQRLLERVADKAAGHLDAALESLSIAPVLEMAEATTNLQSLSADIDLDVNELESWRSACSPCGPQRGNMASTSTGSAACARKWPRSCR